MAVGHQRPIMDRWGGFIYIYIYIYIYILLNVWLERKIAQLVSHVGSIRQPTELCLAQIKKE